jgi:hypothetical protein
MDVFTITKNVINSGIIVDLSPFAKIAIGKFNTTKRPTWIPIGQNDLETITKNIGECKNRNKQVIVVKEEDKEKKLTKTCRICGIELNVDGTHPDDGYAKKLVNCDIIQLKDNNGKFKNHLIIAPKDTTTIKDKILVLWKVPFKCNFIKNEFSDIITMDNPELDNIDNELLVILSVEGSIEAIDKSEKTIAQLTYKGNGKIDVSFQR